MSKLNISAIVIFVLSVIILVLFGVIVNMYDGNFNIPSFFESNIFIAGATSLTISLIFLIFSKQMFPPDASAISDYKNTYSEFMKSIDDINNLLSNLRMQVFCESFPNTDYVVDSMKEDIGKSNRIICFTARGDTATKILDRHLNKIKPEAVFSIILAHKDNTSMPKRASALNMSKADYVALIDSQVTAIQTRTRNNGNVKILFHKQPICFRFIMLDNCIYWGFYEDKKTGTVTDMFKADSASVVYKAFCQYYELLCSLEGWEENT